MHRLILRTIIATALACSILVTATVLAAGPPDKTKPADLYDKAADGTKQIAEALVKAKRDNRRVLLQFGANWCGWCHKLHKLFKTDREIARLLKYEFVVVLIDVDKIDGETHNEAVVKRYGNPLKRGIPALVVLDADGKQLTTKHTEELEEGDHHNPTKVLDFLKKWQPEPQSADKVLAGALARAKADSKKVFVFFSAPWCGWCHRFEDYLRREEIAKVFNLAYVPVKIDIDRMTGGKDMEKKYRGSEGGGIPFFAVLEPDGGKLADSNGEKGNVGCPVEPHEIAHYMKVVHQTAPKLTTKQLAVLEDGLKTKKD